MRRRTHAAILALAAALACAAGAAAATADKEKIQLTAAGQAAARAAVLTRADLGATTGWTGGAQKPDLTAAKPTCKGFDPKQSDLTLNGAAEAMFKHSAGIQLVSDAQVLATPRMVALDWQRTVLAPQVVPCMREELGKLAGGSGHIVSLSRISFPKLATYSTAFRALFDVTSGTRTIRVMADVVLVGRGRTELTLTTTAPYSAAATIAPAEVRLARVLLARVRA
jgi:hypothetical protein